MSDIDKIGKVYDIKFYGQFSHDLNFFRGDMRL